MTDDLRTSLHRVAEGAAPLPVADDLWQRGRAARRRGQALAVAAVVVLLASVGGIATLVTTTDQEARTASGEVVEAGAIPSRIVDPGDPQVAGDLALGQASVAFVSGSGETVVVGANDGVYHAVDLEHGDGELVSLSPDGRTLAWTFDDASEPDRPMRGVGLLDLDTGETSLRGTVTGGGEPVTAEQVSWSAGSQWLAWSAGETVGRMPVGTGELQTTTRDESVDWVAVDDDGVVTMLADGVWAWELDGAMEWVELDLHWGPDLSDRGDRAVASPTGNTIALSTKDSLPSADFVTSGGFEERPLATDLYPDGAVVRPLGWASDTLVLARLDGPAGSYVEGPHVALFTAPNTPEQQWTYRVVLRDIPDTDTLTIAVDLVPDLDGTSSQRLTRDFPVPEERDISWLIGLGVAAAIAVLMGLRWLWRRLLG